MWIITYLESVVIAFFVRCLYIRNNKEANIEEIMKCYQINPRNPEGILFGRLMLYSVFWPWFLSDWILEKTIK